MPKRSITVRIDDHDWQVITMVAAGEGLEPTTWIAREARRAALAAELAGVERGPLENQDWLEATSRESRELWAKDGEE
ncbi:hypothetical protein AB0K52_17865 [Glycomyces sp. NPDC049804]|uniref:hypothetical protein n=1 Tax=Glycomyces sp. NPDC049804 TaxID=3154363 RepID=UPI003437CA7B